MELFWTFLFAFIALAWIGAALQMIPGMARLPRLAHTPPLPDADCPSVSILVAGRDEAEKMPRALATLLALDYPNYEVAFVDDRSTDATPQILDDLAAKHKHLKVIHLRELPKGWLGKPHALQKAYENSSGEWLIFTDADVRFAPDVLRRSLSLAKRQGWDHLTLFGLIDVVGFWEKVLVNYFFLGFTLNTRPWAVSNPRSRAYVGVGSFQLLRRLAYETIGTHKRLALEVVDDLGLGKLVKQGGFRSGVGIAEDSIRLRWRDGVGDMIHGLTKNTFAFLGFSLARTLGHVLFSFLLGLLPFLALPFASDRTLLLAALAAACAVIVHAHAARGAGISPLYALTHPLGIILMNYITLRSAVVTLWRGGVVWRDTFYPLEELRKGRV